MRKFYQGKLKKVEPTKPTGSKNNRAKLTESTALQIFNARGAQRKIARQFHVSPATVCEIKSKKIWTHIHEVLS